MNGIPRELVEHTLWINPESKPVKWWLRRFDEKRCKAIREEISKLLAAGFIQEIHHPNGWPTSCWSERKAGNGECL